MLEGKQNYLNAGNVKGAWADEFLHVLEHEL